jgi:hypothetical protein
VPGAVSFGLAIALRRVARIVLTSFQVSVPGDSTRLWARRYVAAATGFLAATGVLLTALGAVLAVMIQF